MRKPYKVTLGDKVVVKFYNGSITRKWEIINLVIVNGDVTIVVKRDDVVNHISPEDILYKDES